MSNGENEGSPPLSGLSRINQLREELAGKPLVESFSRLSESISGKSQLEGEKEGIEASVLRWTIFTDDSRKNYANDVVEVMFGSHYIDQLVNSCIIVQYGNELKAAIVRRVAPDQVGAEIVFDVQDGGRPLVFAGIFPFDIDRIAKLVESDRVQMRLKNQFTHEQIDKILSLPSSTREAFIELFERPVPAPTFYT